MACKPKFIKIKNKKIRVPNKSYRFPICGIIKACNGCGNPFYVSLCHLKAKKKHYCSVECLKTRIKSQCSFCGKDIYIKNSRYLKKYKNYFCSRSCVGKYQTLNGKITRRCIICNKEFQVSKSVVDKNCGKYCSIECYSISISGINNINWKGGYYQFYGYGFNKMIRDVRKRDIICQTCGKTDDEEIADTGRRLSVHHIVPYDDVVACHCGCGGKLRDFPEFDKFIYFNGMKDGWNWPHPNRKENGILLCNKCHAKEHNKLRKIKYNRYHSDELMEILNG